MFLGFNETWRWGWREDQKRYNEFWIQLVRYMARSKQGRVRLDLDRQMPYRRGEPIRVTVRFPDDAPPPDEDKVTVKARRTSRGAATEWEMTLSKLPGSRGTYEDVLTQTPEGEYKFAFELPAEWKAKLDGASYTPRAECRVTAPPDEMYGLHMNAKGMKDAADKTGGSFYTLADADQVPSELPEGELGPPRKAKTLLLWNGVTCFFFVLLLVTTEWLIRKQKNLL